MDRELLIEIGVEELPAAWLPGLTRQLAERLGARLTELRIAPGAPIESFSTPRRLTARVARIAERQEDLDETITGPPVSAAFGADGQPTPAAARLRARSRASPFEQLDARRDAEGRVPRLPEAPARQERGRRAAGRARRRCCAIWRSPSRCTGTRRSTTAAASCCSAGRSAGCCSSTAAGSCRSRSAAPPTPPGRRCRTSSRAR